MRATSFGKVGTRVGQNSLTISVLETLVCLITSMNNIILDENDTNVEERKVLEIVRVWSVVFIRDLSTLHSHGLLRSNRFDIRIVQRPARIGTYNHCRNYKKILNKN